MAATTTCLNCGALYEESSEECANEPDRRCPLCRQPMTIFLCGPSACEHDYSGWQDIVRDGRVVGGTAVCAKCGRSAYDEDAWR